MADNVILITGGGRGIGRAIAERFANPEADVVITMRHEPSDADQSAFKAQGIRWVIGDVTNDADAEQMIENACSSGKWLMALINNAGITKDKLMTRMSEEDFKSVLDTNLTGAFNMTKYALKKMQRQRRGSIIDITSVIGLTGNIGQANYAASKAGLIGLMKSTAREGALRNVRCNAIAPGMVRTQMTDELSDSVKEKILTQIPLKRFAEPAEVANVAAFLLENEYLTGQVITVDGGLTL